MSEKMEPRPGSPEALEQGCKCPVLDNGHGKGHLGDGEKYGWWTNSDCPIHGNAPLEAYRAMKEVG